MTQPQAPIAGAWRVQVEQTYLGQTVYNTLGWLGSVGASPTQAAANDLAQEFVNSWVNWIQPQQNAGVLLVGVTTYSLQDPTVGGRQTVAGSGSEGDIPLGATTQAVSGALCANVRLQTNFRGRRFQGRTGHVGLNEDQVNGNELTVSAQSALQAAYTRFLQEVAATPGGMQGSLAVVSLKYASATPVAAVRVQPRLGTRVSRLR